MKTLIAFAALALAAGISGAAHAQDGITLGEPGYGGTGCPGGSVSATLSPDNTSLSLLFDSYSVEAGGDTGKKFDRKSCNIAIPVHVPQGFAVSVLALDSRGFNQFDAGSDSTFSVEYFVAGLRGPTFTKTFKGPQGDDYLIHNELTAQTVVYSKCGADVNLRTNSSIRVNTKNNKQALATVDSQDVSAAIVYQLQWKQC